MNFFKTSLQTEASLLVVSCLIVPTFTLAMDDDDDNPFLKLLAQPSPEAREDLSLEECRRAATEAYDAGNTDVPGTEQNRHFRRAAELGEDILNHPSNTNPSLNDFVSVIQYNYAAGLCAPKLEETFRHFQYASDLCERLVDSEVNPHPTAQMYQIAASSNANMASHYFYFNGSEIYNLLIDRATQHAKRACELSEEALCAKETRTLDTFRIAIKSYLTQHARPHHDVFFLRPDLSRRATELCEMLLDANLNPNPLLDDFRLAHRAFTIARIENNPDRGDGTPEDKALAPKQAHYAERAADMCLAILDLSLNPKPAASDFALARDSFKFAARYSESPAEKARYERLKEDIDNRRFPGQRPMAASTSSGSSTASERMSD